MEIIPCTFYVSQSGFKKHGQTLDPNRADLPFDKIIARVKIKLQPIEGVCTMFIPIILGISVFSRIPIARYLTG